jgi:hypothetical protein
MFSRFETAPAASATERPHPDAAPPLGVECFCPISHIPEAVRTLRHRSRTFLTHWNFSPEAIDEALLVISELATNAIEHALPPAELRLRMSGTDGRRILHIEVTDAGPAPRPSPSPDRPNSDESGRGVGIVAALSLRHGTHSTPERIIRWADLPAEFRHTHPATSSVGGIRIRP